jgi:hypothetical protein
MSFTHKIVGKIIGDRKSKNYKDEYYECPSCGKKQKRPTGEWDYKEHCKSCGSKTK